MPPYGGFFLETHPLPPNYLGHSTHTPGPSQCPYTKFLFQNNSYESVYSLARLHTNLHTINYCMIFHFYLSTSGNEVQHSVGKLWSLMGCCVRDKSKTACTSRSPCDCLKRKKQRLLSRMRELA